MKSASVAQGFRQVSRISNAFPFAVAKENFSLAGALQVTQLTTVLFLAHFPNEIQHYSKF